MAEEVPNKGSIWPNRKKLKDTHPNMTGMGLIQCGCPQCGKNFVQPVWISAWTKYTPRGTKWASLSFKYREPIQGKDKFGENPQPQQQKPETKPAPAKKPAAGKMFK